MAQITEQLPELLDVKQVAAYLKLHEITVLAEVREEHRTKRADSRA
jgi:hypothetical protein